jgi:predicted outer membrane repeat protein
VTLINSTFTSNSASKGGAVYANGGVELTIEGVDFTSNIGRGSGGAIELETNSLATMITQSSFIDNTAPIGGAIGASDTSIIISSTKFENNRVTNNGGAVSCVQTGATTPVVTVTASNFTSQSSVYGGAFCSSKCNISTDASTFLHNTATDGGVFYLINDAHATMTGCTVHNNRAGSRGGVVASIESQLICSNSDLRGNLASTGAVFFDDDHAVIETNNVYAKNVAAYGNDGAIIATANSLIVVSGPSIAQSGQAIGTIIVRLYDATNLMNYTAGTQTVTVSMPTDGLASGGVSAIMVAGAATFDEIVVTAPSGGPYSLVFTATLALLDGTSRVLTTTYSTLTISSCGLGTRVVDNVCVTCDQGKHSTDLNALTCTNCPAGSRGVVNDTNGLTTCETCPSGKFQANDGQLTCDQCPAGKYALNIPNQSQCYECSVGTAASIAGSVGSCSLCLAGTYAAVNGSLECIACGAGSINILNGSSSCQPCSGSTYQSLSGQSYCLSCALGTYSVTNLVTPTPIAACTQARPGFYVNSTGSTTAYACSPGTASSSYGSANCSSCAPGSYVSSSQASSCISAARGYYVTSSGSSSQLPCPAGRYSTGGAIVCTTCDPGSWSSGAAETCASCSAGSYQPADSLRDLPCTLCPAGNYSTSIGATSCIGCDRGAYASSTGSVSCSPCGRGTANNLPGQATCPSCPAGSSAIDVGLYECVPCGIGKYSSSANAQSCFDAPAGSYVDSLGASSPTPCLAGTEQPLTGGTNCSECVRGRYAPQGTASCIAAPLGYAANGTGLSTATSCSLGTYSQSLGSSQCLPCAKGTYGPTAALSTCLDCIGASVAPIEGLSACSQCPLHSSAIDNTCECDVGFYAVEVLLNGTIVTSCYTCPSGTSCTTSGSTAAAIQVSSATWKLVLADGTITTSACPGDRCVQGNCTDNRKPVNENPLCGSCINDDYSEWGGQCVYCKDSNIGYIFGVVALSIVWVLFLLRAAKGNSSSHTKIFSYFLATARFMLNDQLNWMQWLGLFDFSPDRGNGGTCVTPLSAYGQMGMQVYY